MKIEKICEEMNLLRNNEGVIHIPFMVKGKIVPPVQMSRMQVEAAFKDADKDILYAKLPNVQIIREPVIDCDSMKYTGDYLYQVMPQIDAWELIEKDVDKLVKDIYSLSVEDILSYLSAISVTLSQNQNLLKDVLRIYRMTSGYPEPFLDRWFAGMNSAFDLETAIAMIDNELSLYGKRGSDFLNGWVKVPSNILPGLTSELATEIFQTDTWIPEHPKTLIKAMPTRQLHITAGNTPDVPVVSALRAILTKSAALIKLPFGVTAPGSLLALVLAAAEPEHPLNRNLSIVYWHGGDKSIENIIFMPNVFDRVVVWGSQQTMSAIQSRALHGRTIYLNPRYGVSFVGREVFEGNLEESVEKASVDSLIYNQKACTASLVHYVEGSEEEINRYADSLRKAFARWDGSVPQFVPPSVKGQIKRLRRGKYSSARWYINYAGEEFASGVVVTNKEFDILDHPMSRLVVVRPVNNLEDALKYLHPGVSTVGIYPEKRRKEMADRILARGVSNVFPLGQCERLFAGMPHDGMQILSQLVDWKNA